MLFTASIIGRAQDSVQPSGTSSITRAPSILVSSGFGFSFSGIETVFWDAQIMTPVWKITNGLLWIGIIPTLNPLSSGDEASPDGFFPIVLQYEYDLRSSSLIPYLFANAGSGIQFGDQSNHQLFQAAMASIGTGIRSQSSGFLGQLGLTANNVPHWRLFLVLNAGIEF